MNAIEIVLELYDNHGQADTINGIFLAPKTLAPLKEGATEREVASSTEAQFYNLPLTNQLTLDGYVPKNNKLLCYPYNYLLVSNNNGSNAIYEYENFSNNPGFRVYMALTPGCSIRIVPLNYKGIDENDESGINMGKLPICSYTNDMYTNWLTQNSINILGTTITSDTINTASNLSNLAFNILGVSEESEIGDVGGILNNVFSIGNALLTKRNHEFIPPQTRGNLNSGDVITSSNKNKFHFYKMSVKQEYARIIDNFFSMYGYLVNTVKNPNLSGRENWNYVKTLGANIEGYIPQEDLQRIKNIFNNGITLWHNPSTFLDYTQNNNII